MRRFPGIRSYEENHTFILRFTYGYLRVLTSLYRYFFGQYFAWQIFILIKRLISHDSFRPYFVCWMYIILLYCWFQSCACMTHAIFDLYSLIYNMWVIYRVNRMPANYSTHVVFCFLFPFHSILFYSILFYLIWFFSLSFIHSIRFGLIRIDSIQFNLRSNENSSHSIIWWFRAIFLSLFSFLFFFVAGP